MTFEQLWADKELPDDLRWSLIYPQRNAWDVLHRDGLPPLLALGVNPFLLVMFAQVYATRANCRRTGASYLPPSWTRCWRASGSAIQTAGRAPRC